MVFHTGWWFGTWLLYAFMTFHILGMSSSQLTNSYFSEGLKAPTSSVSAWQQHSNSFFLDVSGMQKAEQAGLSLSDDAVQARLIFCADFCCLK